MKKKECISDKILNPKTNRCVSRTSKIGKELLTRDCRNINIKWENNSCYIDSLLVALFYRKDKIIEDIFFKENINDYNNPKLKILGDLIRNELINIYKNVLSYNTCSALRILLDKYYRLLIKTNPSKRIIDKNDNWINKQMDIYDLFRLLQIIFNIKENTLKIKEGSNLIYTSLNNQIPIDYLYKDEKQRKTLKISSIYPSYELKYKLSKDDKYKDEKTGKKLSIYKKKIKILKYYKLFINIYRNIGDIKLETKIIPCNSLKLKENNFNLYLTSIIIHYGSFGGGHYICLFKCEADNKWYEYDDMNGIKYIGTLNQIIKNDNYTSNIVGLIYSKL